MRRIITSVLFVMLTVMTSISFAQMADTDIEEAITAKEKEMYEALKSGNMDTFEANMAENFMSVYATGISDREKELESLKNLKINSYELSDITVMQPAKGIAIITYSYTASGMWMNESFNGKYFAASTWVESDGEWKAVMHSDVEAAPMEETMGMQE